MKLLYIHQYYKLPNESGGTRSYWISKGLKNKGHNVVIITSKTKMKSQVERVELENGLEILYLRVPYSNNMSIASRLLAFLSFMYRSCYYALREKNVDLVFATSTPLTVGFPALITKWFKGIPYVFEVRDLWPEVPIQMGALKNRLVIKLAIWFEKTIYKNASSIIALSPGMEDGVKRFQSNTDKVSMIPNMSKIDEFFLRETDNNKKQALGIDPSKFNCIHFGTMGLANGLEYILEAALFAKKNNLTNINFVFLGEGGQESKLKLFAKENNLDNVIFLGAKPLPEVSEIVNACDLSIVSFADIEILKTNSPNKLFDSLSAGKPIIVNSSGWTKTMIEDNKCGLFSDPKKPEDLVEKIQIIQQDSSIYRLFSTNARKLAENKYDKSILVPRVVEVIENAIVKNV